MTPDALVPLAALAGLAIGASRRIERGPQVFDGMLYALLGLALATLFR